MTGSSETRDQNLVVLLDVVQTTVIGHESRDLLSVLDQLDSDTLSDGRVGLFCLDSDLLKDNSHGVRASSEGVSLPPRSQMSFLVVQIVPSLFPSVNPLLSGGLQSTRLTHVGCKGERDSVSNGERKIGREKHICVRESN